jgi:uncharacterized protein (TIGR02118 family)
LPAAFPAGLRSLKILEANMIKLTLLYGHPVDMASFESYYANTHLPLAAKITSVRRAEFSLVTGALDGSKSPYYRIAELYFDDIPQMQDAMGSAEGQAAVADLSNFADGGVTTIVSKVN